MTVIDLIVLQILAHLIADFIFQSEKWVKNKREYGFHSSKLYIHALIVLIISYGLSFHTQFFLASVVIATSHLFLDRFKERIRNVIGKYTYIVDQIFHIGIILIVTYYFTDYYGISPYYEFNISTKHLMMLAGFIIAAKSILRYDNEDSAKTEYVLIGTMLSFGMAVLTYAVIMYVIKNPSLLI